MYHKMHDGPQDYSIVSGHLRRSSFHASLPALQWAADRAGKTSRQPTRSASRRSMTVSSAIRPLRV